MINSLPVLLTVLAFIGFGYITLVRIIWKQQSDVPLFTALSSACSDSDRFLRDLGRSGLFISLPATSLLLFWGWGPALLWLIIFHLFADTIININFSSISPRQSIEAMVRPQNPSSGYVLPFVAFSWQALMVLLSAILLTQIATMLDQQSGLFWALICLLPASSLLLLSNRHIPNTLKQIGAAAVLVLGVVLADTLGVAVYGSWFPLGQSVNWLVINNGTLIALGLLLATALLANNRSFNNQLAALSGFLVLAVSIAALLTMFWLQPELDAPVQSLELRAGSQPPLMAISLLFFGSLLTLMLRFLSSFDSSENETLTADVHFGRWHLLSLYQLVFSILLVVMLAAAMGIGAWKTHYIEWSWQLDLLRHFEIALTSLFEVASVQSDMGSMAYTVFMSALSCIALCLLLFGFRHLRLKDESQPEAQDLRMVFRQSNLGHCILIYLLSCYFLSRGVPLTIWIIIGALTWLVVTQFVINLAIELPKQSGEQVAPKRMLSGLALILMTAGLVQMFRLLLWWLQQQFWVAAFTALALGVAAIILWQAPAPQLLRHFTPMKDPKLFE